MQAQLRKALICPQASPSLAAKRNRADACSFGFGCFRKIGNYEKPFLPCRGFVFDGEKNRLALKMRQAVNHEWRLGHPILVWQFILATHLPLKHSLHWLGKEPQLVLNFSDR